MTLEVIYSQLNREIHLNIKQFNVPNELLTAPQQFGF